MLYQLIDVRFTPHCKELERHLVEDCFEFESSEEIISSLEE